MSSAALFGTVAPSAAGASGTTVREVQAGSPASLVEDRGYPDAATIFTQRGIRLVRGDGHIMLVDCGPNPSAPPADLILVQTYNMNLPGGPDFCFKVTGSPGWLTMEISQVYVIRGENVRTIDATVRVADQPPVTEVERVDPGEWQPVGVGQSRGDATVLELRTGQGVGSVTGAHPAVGKIESGENACTGALIDRQWVASATSCFSDNPDQPTVPVGPPARAARIVFANQAPIAITHLVPRIDRDLVLAKLASPVTGIAAANLATAAPTVNTNLQAVGYGRTANDWAADTQHNATIALAEVTPTTLQANTASGRLCKGHAGGPAFNGRGEIVGIHSRAGQTGCLGAVPNGTSATEARVDNVVRWIGETLGALPVNGSYVRKPDGAIYAIIGGAALWVANEQEFEALGRPAHVPFAAQWVDALGTVPSSGTYLRGPDGRVYGIIGGAKFWVENSQEYETLGRPPYVPAVSRWLAAFGDVPSNGTYVRTPDGRVYAIIGGAKFWVENSQEYETLGRPGYASVLPRWIAAMGDVPRNGTYVRTPDGTVFGIVGGAKFWVRSQAELSTLGWPGYVDALPRWIAALGAVPANGTVLTGPDSNIIYLMVNGKKDALTQEEWNALGRPTPTRVTSHFLNSIPTA